MTAVEEPLLITCACGTELRLPVLHVDQNNEIHVSRAELDAHLATHDERKP